MLTASDLIKGDHYNWKHDKGTKLIYIGVTFGCGLWYQFAKVETPDIVWCEVNAQDIHMLEAS